MLRLSKKIEYSLMAMQFMAGRPSTVVSAKDISQAFGISPALVAKVLQALAKASLIRSYHGINGGYQLAKEAQFISIADVIRAVEGVDKAIVECQHDGNKPCDVLDNCTIREPLSVLQERINNTFTSMSVAELVTPRQHLVSLTLS